jgi:uncharacterized membrane protein (DUF373 family)
VTGSIPSMAAVVGDPGKRILRILRVFETAENGIHVLVATLLIGLSVGLLVDAVFDVINTLRGKNLPLPAVLNVLDKTLVLIIVAELLHTVRITIQHRGRLNAEPFLIVGLIAGVRRVLILTAQSEVSFHWDSEGIELTILTGLIIAMAMSILIYRRSARRDDES